MNDNPMPEPAAPTSPNAEDSMEGYVGPDRKKMPDERSGITHKVEIRGNDGTAEGYITVNWQDDGTLGEMFLHGFGKDGSTLQGWVDSFAIMFSIGLQYGAELPMLARKFAHMKFPPAGATDNPDIPHCWSVPDYIFKYLAQQYGDQSLIRELQEIDKEMRNGSNARKHL